MLYNPTVFVAFPQCIAVAEVGWRLDGCVGIPLSLRFRVSQTRCNNRVDKRASRRYLLTPSRLSYKDILRAFLINSQLIFRFQIRPHLHGANFSKTRI